VVESAETGLLALDQELRIWKTNRKGNEILRQKNLEGKSISVLKGLDLDLDQIYTNPSAWKDKECDIRHGNKLISIIYSAQPVVSSKNELLGVVLVFEEVENIWKLAKRISSPRAYFTFDNLIGNSLGTISGWGAVHQTALLFLLLPAQDPVLLQNRKAHHL